MLALVVILVSALLFASVAQSDAIMHRQNVGCSFHMSTAGAVKFPVGELPNGQARAGSTVSPALFTWFGDDFVDQLGRGCWWTPPSNILQCDNNQLPSHGFDIACGGAVTYNGQSIFYECQTGDGDQVNIYLQPSGAKCEQITLVADACAASCPNGASGVAPMPATTGPSGGITPGTPGATSAPSAPGPTGEGVSVPWPSPEPFTATFVTSNTFLTASMPEESQTVGPTGSDGTAGPTPTGPNGGTSPTAPGGGGPSSPTGPGGGSGPSPPPANSGPNAAATPTPLPPPAKDCAADLSGSYDYPHLVVPVDRANPDKAYGSSIYGQVSQNASTIYNFDFPPSDQGKSCKLFFAFPLQNAAGTEYYLEGDGRVQFSRTPGSADLTSTWTSTGGGDGEDLGVWRLTAGTTFEIDTFECPAGKTVSFSMREPPGLDTCVVYVQEFNPNPLGLFVSKC